jgi:hypothetical protein
MWMPNTCSKRGKPTSKVGELYIPNFLFIPRIFSRSIHYHFFEFNPPVDTPNLSTSHCKLLELPISSPNSQVGNGY